MRLGSTSEFSEYVEKGVESPMGCWYEAEDTYLYRKTLNDAINLVNLGMLAFTGNFVDVNTVIEALNQLLGKYCPALKNKIGVKLGNTPKTML